MIFYDFFHENINNLCFRKAPENQTVRKIEKKKKDLYNQFIIKIKSLITEFEVKI